MLVRLGVNIDHVATLREVRKTSYPDILEACRAVIKGGADQITVHLREDRRHIQERDVKALLRYSRKPVNLEMAFVSEMIDFACRWKPYSVTLVPERRAEMTTESGLNLKRLLKKKRDVKRLQRKTRVYGFVDSSIEQVKYAEDLELQGLEFHTGELAHSCERGDSKFVKIEMTKLQQAADYAFQLGMEVKAGHGLTLENLKYLKGVSGLSELNIGHSIVARSVFIGLEEATREMKEKIKNLAL